MMSEVCVAVVGLLICVGAVASVLLEGVKEAIKILKDGN